MKRIDEKIGEINVTYPKQINSKMNEFGRRNYNKEERRVYDRIILAISLSSCYYFFFPYLPKKIDGIFGQIIYFPFSLTKKSHEYTLFNHYIYNKQNNISTYYVLTFTLHVHLSIYHNFLNSILYECI